MSVPPVGPLGYTGTVAVPFIVEDSSPTSADFKNFKVPTIWVDPSNESAWILTAKPQDSAKWHRFVTAGSSISFLQGNNTSINVGPNTSGVVKIVGASGQIDVAGDEGSNTLTLSLAGGGQAVDSLQADGGGNQSSSSYYWWSCQNGKWIDGRRKCPRNKNSGGYEYPRFSDQLCNSQYLYGRFNFL